MKRAINNVDNTIRLCYFFIKQSDAFLNAGVYEKITEYTAFSPSVYRLEIASYEGKAELITSDERYTGVLIRDYAQTELAALTEQNRQGGE